MKNLLIAFLLAIFSVQGTVAAMGGDIAAPLQGQEKNASASGSGPDSATDDPDVPKVSSTAEELSDYAVCAAPPPEMRYRAAAPAASPVFLSSVDLPRLKPPPRG